MTDKINIPADDAAFRKLIKTTEHTVLKKLDKEQLQQLYEKAKEAYPEKGKPLSRNERINLYTIQEKLFGGVDTKLVKSLENIGETLVKSPSKRKKSIDYNMPSDGAIIVKHWKGKKLQIKIVKSGFEYEGRVYKSLSRLAKEVSGYAVSGPIFFGLRKAKVKVG